MVVHFVEQFWEKTNEAWQTTTRCVCARFKPVRTGRAVHFSVTEVKTYKGYETELNKHKANICGKVYVFIRDANWAKYQLSYFFRANNQQEWKFRRRDYNCSACIH